MSNSSAKQSEASLTDNLHAIGTICRATGHWIDDQTGCPVATSNRAKARQVYDSTRPPSSHYNMHDPNDAKWEILGLRPARWEFFTPEQQAKLIPKLFDLTDRADTLESNARPKL
jgi:hypothetical protein